MMRCCESSATAPGGRRSPNFFHQLAHVHQVFRIRHVTADRHFVLQAFLVPVKRQLHMENRP